MMDSKDRDAIASELLQEEGELTMAEFCRMCQLPGEQILVLVEEGIVEPVRQSNHHLHFQITSVRRVRCAVGLRRDLGVNWAGAALALELLDEIDSLRTRLERVKGTID